jgi:hypothetical protein
MRVAHLPLSGLLVHHGGPLARAVLGGVKPTCLVAVRQGALYAPDTAIVFHRRVQGFAVHGEYGQLLGISGCARRHWLCKFLLPIASAKSLISRRSVALRSPKTLAALREPAAGVAKTDGGIWTRDVL